MRIIIYTGKGGVGKTSIAAAAALRCSQLGYRTLIMSTDAAHSLGDVFDCEIGDAVREISPQLFALETNVYSDLEENWGAVRAHLARVVALQGLEEVLAEEAAVLPGMEELFSLVKLRDFTESGQYDCIIVDAAPTGETLRLLSLPQTLAWSVRLLHRAEKYVLKPIIRPLSRLSPALEEMVVSEEVVLALEKMLQKLQAMKKLLANREITTLRLVLNPEKMVINETKRALTYLNMYGLLVDGVVVNRVLEENSGYLEGWRAVQQRYLTEIQDNFSPLPIEIVPQYAAEVVGLTELTKMATALYGDKDPASRFYERAVFEIRKVGPEYLVKIGMPLLQKESVRLRSRGSELVIQIANQRRVISLPTAMVGYQVIKAEYQDASLIVTFGKGEG